MAMCPVTFTPNLHARGQEEPCPGARIIMDNCVPGSSSPPCSPRGSRSPRGSPRKPSSADSGASPWAIASPSDCQSALTLTVYWEGTANTIRPVTTQVLKARVGSPTMAHLT